MFVERVPFSLCLRVWDIYLLDGERVVTAMAYTILKLHKKAIMKLNDMDLIVNYIQVFSSLITLQPNADLCSDEKVDNIIVNCRLNFTKTLVMRMT